VVRKVIVFRERSHVPEFQHPRDRRDLNLIGDQPFIRDFIGAAKATAGRPFSVMGIGSAYIPGRSGGIRAVIAYRPVGW
jgi:hypothetical protein